MILVDTSIWISFFKGQEQVRFLQETISDGSATMHPMVMGELILGGLTHDQEELMGILSLVAVPGHEMVYRFIREHQLFGHGIGWVDANLLVSCLENNLVLLTQDRRLNDLAEKFACSYSL